MRGANFSTPGEIPKDLRRWENNMYHIYPANEEHMHDLDGTCCKCCPIVDWELPEALVIHNSFDGRELIEEAERILNEPNTARSHTGHE